MSKNENRIYLPDIIGGGYKEYWESKKRYVVVKGSRASKKSKTTALWFVFNLMKYPSANLLCVRKTERTLLNSCYSDIQWACDRLGVSEYWKFTKNPLEITYIPNGNKVLFRGCEDILKLTSISVPKGSLCWCWIEEAYELNETMFQTIDESIRGELDPEDVARGLAKRICLTFNPWQPCWLKTRFFDNPDEDTLALTRNYQVNEFLDEADLKMFEVMKHHNPKRYKTAGEGDWGNTGDVIFTNWEECDFKLKDVLEIPDIKSVIGLDFGFTEDTAIVHCYVSNKHKEIYVWDEWYKKKATNEEIYNAAVALGVKHQVIYADSAAPKDISDLHSRGLSRIMPARKGNDSVLHGLKKMLECRIYVHPRCVNFMNEISLYGWQQDKNGNYIDKPMDDYNHGIDAARYCCSTVLRGSLFSFD